MSDLELILITVSRFEVSDIHSSPIGTSSILDLIMYGQTHSEVNHLHLQLITLYCLWVMRLETNLFEYLLVLFVCCYLSNKMNNYKDLPTPPPARKMWIGI